MTIESLSPEIKSLARAELEPGEQVRWVGQPLASRTTNFMVWPVFIFGIPWTAFAVFWTVMASGIFERGHFSFSYGRILFGMFGLPFIAVGVFLLTSPWRARKKLAQALAQTAYLITDRRAILIDGGFVALGPAVGLLASMPGASRLLGQGTRIQSFRPDQLRDMERVQRPDGSGDIVFAKTTTTTTQGAQRIQQIGFIALENAREVEKLLKSIGTPDAGGSPPAETPGEAPPVINR